MDSSQGMYSNCASRSGGGTATEVSGFPQRQLWRSFLAPSGRSLRIILALALLFPMGRPVMGGTEMSDRVAKVGPAGADSFGADNLAIQAAIEEMARQGGGTVQLLPGTYLLQDSVHLRSNVRLVGSGERTVLRKAAQVSSAVVGYLGYGHYDVAVAEPDKFMVGMGVNIRNGQPSGFGETIATLVWRDGNRFGIDQMLNDDCEGASGGVVFTGFPPVSGRFVANVEVRDLAIDGNKAQNPREMNGCRGGGIYLLAVKNATISKVLVHDVSGDGISFQQCTHVRVEDCRLESNTGHGLHPGSGSVGAVMKRCQSKHNGRDGVFFCLRATYNICDSCEFIGNGDHGVSIGDHDTNNSIVNCRIQSNAASGVFFRGTAEVDAPHVTLIAHNTIVDNCTQREEAEILIGAPVRDVHILDNTIGHREGRQSGNMFGVWAATGVKRAHVFGNRFQGAFTEQIVVEGDPGEVSFTEPEGSLSVGPQSAPPGADRHLPPDVRD